MRLRGPGKLSAMVGLLGLWAGVSGPGYAGAGPGAPPGPDLAAGCQALVQGDFPRAIEVLAGVCAQDPRWVRPRQYLALAYHSAGQVEAARSAYQDLQRLSYDWTLAARTHPPELREDVIVAEAEAVLLINESRRAAGLGLLRPEPLLAVCAREHSLQMRDEDFCEHFSPTPGCRAVFDRYRLLYGGLPTFVAENIARTQSGRGTLSLAERVGGLRTKLMESAGHRRNTLLPEATRVGVGLAVAADGTMWTTEMFAQAAEEAAVAGRPAPPSSEE